MKKTLNSFLVVALSMSATTLSAQTILDKDITITSPYDEADYNEDEKFVVIEGVTVTMGHEAMNSCGLPSGAGSQITLAEGSTLILHDSPDTWYPNPEDEHNEDYIDYLYDMNSNLITSIPYNFFIEGNATIICDSKSHFGGSVCGPGNLTLVVGDSTIINTDFDAFLNGVDGDHGFTGTLNIQYLDGSLNQTVQFGNVFPGQCKTCNQYLGNPSCKCWCTIPWTMSVPDGSLLKEAEGKIGSSHIAFPAIQGRCSLSGPATITLKPAIENVYQFDSVVGGASNRNFEIFAGGNVTFTSPIDYECAFVYPRNKYVGLWINSPEPCFVNCANSVSVRGVDGFVGGDGILDCSIDCKDGTTTHICPGAGLTLVGDLTVNRNVYLNNNNAIDVDFGADGTSDRLIVNGQCKIAGEYTRLWINLTPEFYASPKAGDYKLIDAVEFIPNTVYETDTTGVRYYEYEGFDLYIDSISAANFDADKDSIRSAWSNKFQFIERIDTLSSEVSQSLVIKANLFEDGTSCDSLPTGYSWYPLEWDDLELTPEELAAKKDELMAEKFFTKGIISIYGPGYKEGNIVNSINEIAKDNSDKQVVESRIFTLDGKEIVYPQKGINIIRYRYDDGTIESKKIIRVQD